MTLFCRHECQNVDFFIIKFDVLSMLTIKKNHFTFPLTFVCILSIFYREISMLMLNRVR